MGEVKGFLKYQRAEVDHRPIEERIYDFDEMDIPLTPDALVKQAARCADCGIAFCHGVGCPVANRIPEFNDLVYRGNWRAACDNLHSTNNFPEITGRICPAPCEASCTLAVNDDPVMIRHIEYQIVEKGFAEGWIVPMPAEVKTGKRVAVIGSGPAGLAATQELARMGHDVTMFEKDGKVGGLLRYGIPDFKLNKHIIDRRLKQLEEEGVNFQTGVEVGVDISARSLRKMLDCVCLTLGAGEPRDLNVAGRENKNVLFAWDFLSVQNKLCSKEHVDTEDIVSAKDKHVVVIGGGDTGSDCVGTSRRQGAKSITQLEILPKPTVEIPDDTPWPMWPRIMRTSTSQEEGCDRRWSVMTKEVVGKNGFVSKLKGCEVEWTEVDGKWQMEEVSGSDFTVKADLILLAMGYVHVVHQGIVEELGLELDGRGNIVVNNYQSSQDWVFAAGDTTLGASLVVRAIDGGRRAATAIDEYLKKT